MKLTTVALITIATFLLHSVVSLSMFDVELILIYLPPFCILWKRLSMLPLSLILLSRLAILFYENSYGFSGLLITP